MAHSTSDGRPAAKFIAPIMPSDRGNGLAMRTGFLLDTYAKRYAVDLAVVLVAGGTNELTPFVKARTLRCHRLWPGAPDTHFALLGSLSNPEATLAALSTMGRPSITARLSVGSECNAARL